MHFAVLALSRVRVTPRHDLVLLPLSPNNDIYPARANVSVVSATTERGGEGGKRGGRQRQEAGGGTEVDRVLFGVETNSVAITEYA